LTTVTKIFVVLVCLFAFIFTPMMISFASRTRNWKQAAEMLQEHAQTALAYERSTLATAASTIEHYKSLRDKEAERAREAEQRIADLERQMQDMSIRLEEFKASQQSWENSAQTLSAQLKVINTHNQELTKENRRLLDSELELQSRNIDLKDRIEELSARLVIFRRQLMQKTEELTAVRNENEMLREGQGIGQASSGAFTSGPTPSVGPGATAPQAPILGTITQVNQPQGLASIDVGRSAGLTEGMRMVVIRGDNYVADLVITGDITPAEAVGRVEPASAQVLPGDRVMDASSFMAE
jgi:hypothetical protein